MHVRTAPSRWVSPSLLLFKHGPYCYVRAPARGLIAHQLPSRLQPPWVGVVASQPALQQGSIEVRLRAMPLALQPVVGGALAASIYALCGAGGSADGSPDMAVPPAGLIAAQLHAWYRWRLDCRFLPASHPWDNQAVEAGPADHGFATLLEEVGRQIATGTLKVSGAAWPIRPLQQQQLLLTDCQKRPP